MLSASRKIVSLSNVTSSLKHGFHTGALSRLSFTCKNPSLNDLTKCRNRPFPSHPISRKFYVTSTSLRLESLNEETSLQEENLNAQESITGKDDSTGLGLMLADVGDAAEAPTKRAESTSQTQKKYRNYTYNDYPTGESLMKEFRKLLEKEDADITPVTAYQFIRSCGSRMSAESPEKRIELVDHIWQELKNRGVPLETTHHNTLLSVYIQNRHRFSPLEFLAGMQENKTQPDKSTYMLIVQAYCQEGDLSGAMRVIDFMTKQDIPVTEPIYTALVTGYSKNNDMDGAYKILDTMRSNGVTPEVDTYTALISGYACTGDMESIDQVLDEMKANSVNTNSLVFMNMLDSLCRNGYSSLIPEALDRIKHKTPVEMELRFFLQKLIARGDYESAAVLAKNNQQWLPSNLLRQDDFSPYNMIVYRLIRADKPLDEFLKAMKVLEAHGITCSPLEDVLDHCHWRKNTDDAVKMLEMLRDENRKIKPHYAYPILVQLAGKQDTNGILDLLAFLNESNVQIDSNLFTFASRGFKNADNDEIDKLMQFAKAKGIKVPYRAQKESLGSLLEGDDLDKLLAAMPDLPVTVIGGRGNIDKVTSFLLRTYDEEKTAEAIIQMDKKNVYRMGWMLHRIFGSFNKSDDKANAEKAFKLFNTLLDAGAKKGITPFVYTTLLSTFFRNNLRDEFFKVVNVMKEEGLEPNEAQYFIMLKMSSLIGNSAAAQFCFDKLQAFHEPTEAQYNGLIIAYGKDDGKGQAADEPNYQYARKVASLYEEMNEKGMNYSWAMGIAQSQYMTLLSKLRSKKLVNELAISQVLVALLSLGRVEEADEIKKLHGIGSAWRKYAVYNEYMRAYSKASDSEGAMQLMDEIQQLGLDNFPSIFTYNQLIGAFKTAGKIDQIFEIVKNMEARGIKPNKVTYGEIVKTYLNRNEPEQALAAIENIGDVDNFPSLKVFNSLIDEFVKKTDVQCCERVIALIRRQNIDEWSEQRMKHTLLLLYLKDDNYSAANDIINKVDFRLTQRLIIDSLRSDYKNVEFLLKVKNFLKDSNLNYFLMDLALLNAYVAHKDVEKALQLYEEKKEVDVSLTTYFLSRLAAFLKSEGREVPFDISLLSPKPPTMTDSSNLSEGNKEEDDGQELNLTDSSQESETKSDV